MNKFQTLFEKSNSDSVTYKGKKIYLTDYISLNKNDIIKVKILSSNGNRTQIFSIRVEEPKNNKCLEINGKKVVGIPFHEKIMPKEGVIVKILKDNVKIKVWNRGSSIWAWPTIIEQIDNRRVYYSNADDPDEKFDDLVFEIKIVRYKDNKE